jgi:hypothetical protein
MGATVPLLFKTPRKPLETWESVALFHVRGHHTRPTTGKRLRSPDRGLPALPIYAALLLLLVLLLQLGVLFLAGAIRTLPQAAPCHFGRTHRRRRDSPVTLDGNMAQDQRARRPAVSLHPALPNDPRRMDAISLGTLSESPSYSWQN